MGLHLWAVRSERHLQRPKEYLSLFHLESDLGERLRVPRENHGCRAVDGGDGDFALVRRQNGFAFLR